MSDDKNAILIGALEASGSEREANLARAILGDPAAPAAAAAAEPAAPVAPVEIPAAPLVPTPIAAAAAQQGPQPPPGKAPLTTADLNTISQAEAVQRMDEIEALERQEQQQRRAG
jgi:hypothetical protein